METKKCFKCNKIKPLSDYYKHPMMADGHLNKCKECTKEDVHKYREENLEKIQVYEKGRGMLPHRVEARNNYYINNKDTEKYKKTRYESIKKYRERNPEKYKAHRIIQYQLRKGYIKKLPCAICGDIKSEAHHPDYDYPLNVIWLCSKHHKEEHYRLNNPF